MTEWIEPKNFKDWSYRVLALRPILLMLVVSSVLVLEMRFDWVERILGAYLVTTNAVRPESGTIWEKGRRTRTAQKTLEKILTERQTIQREARNAVNFSQIAANLSVDQGAMVSVERFRQLYLQLPPTAAREVISPFELLAIGGKGNWRRTYFEKAGRGLTAYLLDGDNRVLRQLEIPSNALLQLSRADDVSAANLDKLPSFKNRIYPAARYFEALTTFPEDIRRNMILHPEMLLKSTGQMVRVGISDEAVAGFIEMGFEFVNGAQHHVILVQGHEWAVWRLRSYLERKSPTLNPIHDYLEDRTPR